MNFLTVTIFKPYFIKVGGKNRSSRFTSLRVNLIVRKCSKTRQRSCAKCKGIGALFVGLELYASMNYWIVHKLPRSTSSMEDAKDLSQVTSAQGLE